MTVAQPITAHPLHVVVAGAGALGGAALGAEAAAGDRGAGGGQRLHGHVAAWTREHVNTADTCIVVVRCFHNHKKAPTRANILKAACPLL